jgi:molybdopterin synthase catalytic subunit
VDRIEIVDEVIEPQAILSGLAGSADGAVALFLGVVRDHNEGRQVRRLEYHAYAEMALRVMRDIAADSHSRFGVSSIAIVHRKGSLEVGEVAVLVAVATPHRGEAFEACRHAMERVKHEVPIWKKEYFEGGAEWVRGCGTADAEPTAGG